jgi:hypothetical protein
MFAAQMMGPRRIRITAGVAQRDEAGVNVVAGAAEMMRRPVEAALAV